MTDFQHDAHSIKGFCQRNDLSEGMFFKLAREGIGPRVMKVGRRTLISREAAEAWRREREAAAARSAEVV